MSELDATASDAPIGRVGMFIEIPDEWDEMTYEERFTWMEVALTKIGETLDLGGNDDAPTSSTANG